MYVYISLCRKMQKLHHGNSEYTYIHTYTCTFIYICIYVYKHVCTPLPQDAKTASQQ